MHTRAHLAIIGLGACLALAGCDKIGTPASKATEGAVGKAGAATILELNDETFGSQPAAGVMLVDFWAPWCGPCRQQAPIVEQVAAQLGGSARVIKINVDQAPQLAQKYASQGIPTLIVFKNGSPVKRFVGTTPAEELLAAVKAAQ